MSRVVVVIADHEFKRCPLTYQDAKSLELVVEGKEGRLEASNYFERMSLPAKRFQALNYLSMILEFTNGH